MILVWENVEDFVCGTLRQVFELVVSLRLLNFYFLCDALNDDQIVDLRRVLDDVDVGRQTLVVDEIDSVQDMLLKLEHLNVL